MVEDVQKGSSEGWHCAVFFDDLEDEFEGVDVRSELAMEKIINACNEREEVSEVTIESDGFYVVLFTDYSPCFVDEEDEFDGEEPNDELFDTIAEHIVTVMSDKSKRKHSMGYEELERFHNDIEDYIMQKIMVALGKREDIEGVAQNVECGDLVAMLKP